MPRIKERPSENPNWTKVYFSSNAKEKAELDLVSREFALKTFVGRIVVNWCTTCGKWKMHYVPKAKEQEKVAGFVEVDETFPCTACKRALPLVVDEAHTILRNA